MRYTPENILLVGGPNEASHNITSYLGPLFAELEEAWNTGFRVSYERVPITI